MSTTRKAAKRGSKASADKQLARYRSMRDFNVTREPSGADSAASQRNALPFVIQKHAATRLHYDFRLGWNGVLKSWAVTKGPSYYPGDKRLAVQVEDHPLNYGGFEGIIPKGQYGGGTVMLWDRGTWEPHVDVDEGLRNGSLKFALHGEKMHGNWALVRMGGRAANESKPNWLLIKEHDDRERGESDRPITEEAPDSVLSGRDLNAIAQDQDRVWQSNRSEKGSASVPIEQSKSAAKSAPRIAKKLNVSKELAGAAQEALPKFIAPQLAALAKTPPSGDRWIHELKLDGYRIQARVDGKANKVQLLTRTGLDWTHRMPSIEAAVRDLPVKSALLDGEVVVLGADGVSSFADLQASFQEGAKHELIYFAFDLLHLDGHNLRGLPLTRRKEMLGQILVGTEQGVLRLSEDIAGDGKQIFNKACELGTEGIISKVADGTYQAGRSGSWLKIKCYREQELVIAGFTLPSNGIYGVGALLLGYYQDKVLVYAGRTGTGFTQKTHKLLREQLEKLKTSKSPYVKVPAGAGRGAIWVKPELVAQISFSNWTADNLVRQASFKGLREDKPAKFVVKEDSQAAATQEAHDAVESPAADQKHTVKAPHRSAKRAAEADRKVISKSESKRVTALNSAKSEREEEAIPVRLTHPDKVIDTESKVTKATLARYYMAIADTILQYVSDRPLTLVRCVNGSGKPCFYQKHKNEMLSDGFGSVNVLNRKTGVEEPYITVSSPRAIVELAQISVLELHPWGSRNETLEQPDRLIFDLDPDAAISWQTIAACAKEVRKRLQTMGLKSFVKTTGGKGLHVVVPVEPDHEWPAVKEFAHKFVLSMEKDKPKLFLTKMSKAARVGKIFLDYLRNDRGSTAVAPFSPRSRPGLPVAVPLSWSELDADQLPRFHVADFTSWQNRLRNNPWKEMERTRQRLKLS